MVEQSTQAEGCDRWGFWRAWIPRAWRQKHPPPSVLGPRSRLVRWLGAGPCPAGKVLKSRRPSLVASTALLNRVRRGVVKGRARDTSGDASR